MKPVFFTLVLLSGLAGAQPTSSVVHEIDDPRVREHRTKPEEALHRTQQEMDAPPKMTFRIRPGRNCVFEVVVTAEGAVESFEPKNVSQFCAPHVQDAEAILRNRVYKPWLIDGLPSKVRIVDWVNIYPPERWGPPLPFPENVDRSSLEFELERTVCFGTCPSYTVSVSGDGMVRFDGRERVAVPGHQTAHISPEAVTDLLAKFRSADFLSAWPAYQELVTDSPTQKLTLRINGQTKTVTDYVGLSVGLPLAIEQLEDAIDIAAGTDRWVKGK